MNTSDKVLKYMSSFSGREKALRTVQYVTRTIYGALRNSSYKDLAEKAWNLSRNIALVRKVLRFGMPIGVTINLIRRQLGDMPTLTKMIKNIADIFLILYYLTDHILYIRHVGLIPHPLESKFIQRVDLINNITWLIENIFTVIGDALDIHALQQQLQEMVRPK
jgi:hypothetical protein